MDALELRLEQAKQDSAVLNQLIEDYLPFIKKEAGKNQAAQIEYEDRVSLGMLVFANCVEQYYVGKGGFISFASACIRNRLIDEEKKASRLAQRLVPFSVEADEEGQAATAEVQASLQQYELQREQNLLAEEIEQLSHALQEFGVSFEDLPQNCPRQTRSRQLCMRLARTIKEDEDLREAFLRQRRLPQAQLAQSEGISPKTIEKHRKYIVALTVILINEYPGVQAFLPQCMEE